MSQQHMKELFANRDFEPTFSRGLRQTRIQSSAKLDTPFTEPLALQVALSACSSRFDLHNVVSVLLKYSARVILSFVSSVVVTAAAAAPLLP